MKPRNSLAPSSWYHMLYILAYSLSEFHLDIIYLSSQLSWAAAQAPLPKCTALALNSTGACAWGSDPPWLPSYETPKLNLSIFIHFHPERGTIPSIRARQPCGCHFSRAEKGVITKGLVSLNRSPGYLRSPTLERGKKTPTPKISALLRKQPVLLRANFVLTKDRKWAYYGHFCGKIYREGSCSKAAGGP